MTLRHIKLGTWICAALVFHVFHLCAADTLSPVEARRQVDVTLTAPRKLSPVLSALIDSDGVLKGADEFGRFLISTPEDKVSSLVHSGAVQLFSSEIPNHWKPVRRLKLSYDPTNKPTPDDLKRSGLNVIEDYEKGSFMIVAPAHNQIDALLARNIQADPRLLYATPLISILAIPPSELVPLNQAPAQAATAAKVPNDPFYRDLWGMRSIRAPAAWAKIHDSRVIVAVIDSGVDYRHVDLKDNMWADANGKHGYDFVENNDYPMDRLGHGTHCAGTIGAVGNNGVGVVGVNWKVRIMAVRWLDEKGSGDVVNAIKAIDFAVAHGAKVLNASWFWTEDDPDLAAAIKRARDANVLFVAAAGNFAMSAHNNGGDDDQTSTYGRYPSAYPISNIIAVAAIEGTEKLALFSNWGRKTVHLAAPGVLIKSTVPNGAYDTYSGTSMAAPHVAGAAALVMARFPTLGPGGVKSLLLDNARKIASLRGRCVTGGTLDLSFLAQGAPASP